MTNERKPSPTPPSGVAKVPVKGSLPDEELKRYRDSGSLIMLQPNETLIEQGAEPGEMYVVTGGVLGVYMDGVQVAEIHESEVVGEMAFLLEKPHTATVRAISVCEVHAISPRKMGLLLKNSPQAVFGMMQLFARRVEAANHAVKARTDTAQSARLRVEELERQLAQDTAFLNRERGTAQATIAGLNEQVETAKTRITELEDQQRGTIASLEGAEDRIAQLEALHPETKKVVKVFSPVVERSVLELEIDDDLDLLAPPPAEPASIARVALRQIAALRPVPSPVFTEEGPTEEMAAVPDVVVPPPLPNAPVKSRRDETTSYATTPKGPPPADPDVFIEVSNDEVSVVEEPGSGPIQAPQQSAVPIGRRTQSMVAFDPDAYRREIVIDDHGARASSPLAEPRSVPPPARLDNELDQLLAEMRASTPDDKAPKG